VVASRPAVPDSVSWAPLCCATPGGILELYRAARAASEAWYAESGLYGWFSRMATRSLVNSFGVTSSRTEGRLGAKRHGGTRDAG